jgi:ABC-type polysaccharide/polyol phosphate export permease
VVACLSVAYPAWAALEYPTHLLQSLPTLAAMVVGLLAFFAMFFISGGGPPDAILPEGVARAADALPMAYAVDVLQRGWWTGEWDATGLAVQVAVLVAATAVALWRLRDA